VRHRLTLGLVTATAAVLAGCASSPDGALDAQAYECPVGTEGCDVVQPVGDGGEMFVISSQEGEFSFTVEDGIAVTGPIQMTLENVGAGVHNVEALGAADGSEVVEAQPGEEVTGEILLFPGEWTIICNIPGHRASGMEATVQVFATAEEAEEAEASGVDPNEGEDAPAGGGEGADGEETVLEPSTDA
jgi:plastocyanin